jgi:hypothetical protein
MTDRAAGPREPSEALEGIREQRRAYEAFTPLTDEQVKVAVSAIQVAIGEWGSDRLHAQWARHVLTVAEENLRAVDGVGGLTPPLGPDGIASAGGNETPLSDIAAMAVDLGPPNLSSTFRQRLQEGRP